VTEDEKQGAAAGVEAAFKSTRFFYQTCVLAEVGGDGSIRYKANIFDSKCRSKTWSKYSTGLIS
jgi:hypothetical protein